MAEMTCSQLREISAELALGIADGHERAEALAHLEHCAECRKELRGLGEVVEALTELAPAAEPPAGFESRVLAALPRARQAGAAPVTPLRRGRAWLAAAAAAVVLAGGGFALGDVVTGNPGPARAQLLSAVFVEGHRDVGQVVLSPASEGWISVAVHSMVGSRRVRCELIESGGRRVTVGTFALDHGYGYWAAPLPSSWWSARSADLVTSGGRIVAVATLSR